MKKVLCIFLLSLCAYGDNHLQEADKQYAIGNFSKAIELYTKALLVNPKDCTAYNNRGLTYYEIKDYKSAIEDYSKEIDIKSNCMGTIINRGVSYSRSGDYKNATKDARKACEMGDCELLDMLKDNGRLQD